MTEKQELLRRIELKRQHIMLIERDIANLEHLLEILPEKEAEYGGSNTAKQNP